MVPWWTDTMCLPNYHKISALSASGWAVQWLITALQLLLYSSHRRKLANKLLIRPAAKKIMDYELFGSF